MTYAASPAGVAGAAVVTAELRIVTASVASRKSCRERFAMVVFRIGDSTSVRWRGGNSQPHGRSPWAFLGTGDGPCLLVVQRSIVHGRPRASYPAGHGPVAL